MTQQQTSRLGFTRFTSDPDLISARRGNALVRIADALLIVAGIFGIAVLGMQSSPVGVQPAASHALEIEPASASAPFEPAVSPRSFDEQRGLDPAEIRNYHMSVHG